MLKTSSLRAFLLGLALFLNLRDVGAASAAGAYVLNEKFNSFATGSAPGSPWSVVSTGSGSVSVREVPFAADKSVQVRKIDTSGTSSLTTNFADQRGRVVFEAKVMAAETVGFKAIPYIYDSSGNAVAAISLQDGNIKAYVGSTAKIIEPALPNIWYLVRVVIDTDAAVFDLYIDGVRKQQRQPLRTPSGSVGKISYYMDGVNTGTLYVDSVKIYTEAGYIGAPPAPVFDVRDFGAKGDGSTKDTAAIQNAIDAVAGTGGTVLLTAGTYLSGMLTLRDDMTFFIAPSATLRGSTAVADYPEQIPRTGNTQLLNCKRALLYAPNTGHLIIDGGGTIDGQGDAFSGIEGERPMLIWTVLSQDVTVQNLYLMKGAVWSLVSMESDNVIINHINLESDGITHDGIDIVDGRNIVVTDCAVRSGDDAMCLKTGVRRGIDTMTVQDSMFGGSGTSGGSNGIKFGTATYGAFKNIVVQDCYVKDVQYAAMAVESRQGADVDGVSFSRIGMANVGAAFFVYLAQQATEHPVGDTPKLGSLNRVSFSDIAGFTASWPNSPHQGSLITGHVYNGVTYPITNLSFTNVACSFAGGRTTAPGAPPEAMPDQYPESNMFGDLPAWAYYLRHVNGVTFGGCTSSLAQADVRSKLVTDDVTGLSGSP